MKSCKTIKFNNFNTSKTTDISGMFIGCSSLTRLDLTNFNTSKVTNMASMFGDFRFGGDEITHLAPRLTELDLSSFDTGNVTNMDTMFRGCDLLSKICVSDKWNTNNVTDSYDMFYDCTSLIGGAGTIYNSSYIDKTYARIDGGTSNPGYLTDIANKTVTLISGIELNEAITKVPADTITKIVFDRKLIKDNLGEYMASISSSMAGNQDVEILVIVRHDRTGEAYILSEKDIYAPEDCSYMFKNFSTCTSIEFNNFNTSNVENMESMFYGCSSLQTLDLSNFNTGKVVNTKSMFANCNNLKTIYVSSLWDVTTVTDSENMFYRCSNLVGGAGTTYNSSYSDKTYACIDGGTSNPGYFTDIADKPE